MSGLTEQFSAAVEDRSVLELLRAHYHVPLLLLAVVVSLWIRTRGWRNYLRGGEVLFSGNDAWYHLRTVNYSVRNWPFTMPFDPWTRFPTGTSVGQFGTLFDQLVATAALIVGLGAPTDHQIAMTLLFAPAVFGALALIPVYYFAKRVSNRPGALVGVLLLTLTTGQFLTRGVVGFSDHHIAEAFFLALASAAIAYAVTVAQAEKPVYELFANREWDDLRRPVAWAGLAGVCITLYLLTWPPGIFLVGILGIYFAVAMSLYQAKGRSPEHVAVAGVVVGVVTGVLMLLKIEVVEFSATFPSLLQPFIAFGLAAGCAFLAAMARLWDDRDVPAVLYPVGVLAIALAGIGLFALLAPDLYDLMESQVLRVFGYQATAAQRTVAEAQPVALSAVSSFLYGAYRLAVYTALAGFLLLVWETATADEPRHDHLFVLVLAVLLFMATLTQQRFEYYLAIPVAVLNAVLAARIFALVSLHEVNDRLDNLEAYQVMTVVAIMLVVAAPLLIPHGATGSNGIPNHMPADNVTEQRANPGEVQLWRGSLEWMNEETPEIGAYGTGGEGSLEYYGTYERTDDYEYDDGSYGTLAWWDYGHWITVQGQRIPNANPFQQNADYAADVLLAPDEESAVRQLENNGTEETRYVVVDYQLGVGGTRKFSAPAAFETRYGISTADIQRTIFTRQSLQRAEQRGTTAVLESVVTIQTERSFESLRTRLYQSNGGRLDGRQFDNALRGQVVVFDYEPVRITVGGQSRTYLATPQDGNYTRRFRNRSAAREFVEQDGDSQIGGVPGYPPAAQPALQQFRLVHASETNAPAYPIVGNYPWVKTFERVPGATVEGEAPANATVTASVEMKMHSRNETFVYRQQAQAGPDGEFTMTLPYSTTGYDEWGLEEGYTNVSTRATGNYTFATRYEQNESGFVRHSATAAVPEGKVLGEDEEPVTVTLEEEFVELQQGENESDAANGTNATDDTDGSGGENTSDTSNTSDGETNDSSSSLARPRATDAQRARP